MSRYHERPSSPGYTGFSQEQAREYQRIYEEALADLIQNHRVHYHLLLTPSYPANLGTSAQNDFPFQAEAYNAFNRYAQSAFQELFPSIYVLEFQFDDRVQRVREVAKEKILRSLGYIVQYYDEKDTSHLRIESLSLHEKRRKELAQSGSRVELPKHFYVEALQKVQGKDKLAENFFEYVAMLTLAAYQYVIELAQEQNTPVPDFEAFIGTRMEHRPPSNDARNALIQTSPVNSLNYAHLLTALLHAEDKVAALNLSLRQYVLDAEGEELVAKCGFMGAFRDHIAHIVLRRK